MLVCVRLYCQQILYDERLLSEVVKQVNELAEFYTEKNRSE